MVYGNKITTMRSRGVGAKSLCAKITSHRTKNHANRKERRAYEAVTRRGARDAQSVAIADNE